MCQAHPLLVLNGYDYDLHTRPAVEQLHLIMLKASEGCILLNLAESLPLS